MIDEWRNRRKKLKNERAILQSIRLDLEADIKYANRTILRGEWAIKQMRELLDPKTCRAMQPDDLSLRIYQYALDEDEFAGNDHTFNAIAAETRDVISDVELRKSLQFYYSVFYDVAKNAEATAERLRGNREELVRKRVDTVDVKIFRPWLVPDEKYNMDVPDEMHSIQFDSYSAKELLKTKEFRVELHWALQQRECGKFIHQERIAEIKRLLGLLEKHLDTL